MINDSKQFREIISLKKSIIGIDLGKKRTGIAISDINQKIASPFKVYENKKFSDILIILKTIIDERDICAIIVGDPINMDGSIGPKSQSSRSFLKNLSKELDVPIILWDERLSSQGAFNLSNDSASNTSKKISKLDENSAQFILQGALDYLTKENTWSDTIKRL